MGTYTIPRNLKGETRLLLIFSIKSLITTAIGAAIGGLFGPLIVGQLFGQEIAGYVVLGIFGLIGFGAGTIKIPTISGLPITKRIGGESIDEIIIRFFKFRMTKKKYAYFITKEGEK